MLPIRVILGEDHSLVREGTRRVLEQFPDMEVVGEAGAGDEVLALAERLRPDVAILDIRMPGLSGIEVTRRLPQVAPECKALLLTAYDDDDYILAAMEAGASGFLLKTVRSEDLIDAVRTVHSGEPVLQPAIAARIARLWAKRRSDVEKDRPEDLSPREREVLVLAARGLRNREIAEELSISVRTVEGHFNSILGKLGVSSRVGAVLYAASKRWVVLDEEGRR